ncbi:MAG: hypothetical protein R2830_12560 [Saprospiraceae bacterium]
MSKDKGSKNHKKPPADKSGKVKAVSAYKSEGKNVIDPTIEVFSTKKDSKKGGNSKAK